MLKALFFLKLFRFLSWLFGHVGKKLDKKTKVKFKIYGVTDRTTDTYNVAYYFQEVKTIRERNSVR